MQKRIQEIRDRDISWREKEALIQKAKAQAFEAYKTGKMMTRQRAGQWQPFTEPQLRGLERTKKSIVAKSAKDTKILHKMHGAPLYTIFQDQRRAMYDDKTLSSAEALEIAIQNSKDRGEFK